MLSLLKTLTGVRRESTVVPYSFKTPIKSRGYRPLALGNYSSDVDLAFTTPLRLTDFSSQAPDTVVTTPTQSSSRYSLFTDPTLFSLRSNGYWSQRKLNIPRSMRDLSPSLPINRQLFPSSPKSANKTVTCLRPSLNVERTSDEVAVLDAWQQLKASDFSKENVRHFKKTCVDQLSFLNANHCLDLNKLTHYLGQHEVGAYKKSLQPEDSSAIRQQKLFSVLTQCQKLTELAGRMTPPCNTVGLGAALQTYLPTHVTSEHAVSAVSTSVNGESVAITLHSGLKSQSTVTITPSIDGKTVFALNSITQVDSASHESADAACRGLAKLDALSIFTAKKNQYFEKTDTELAAIFQKITLKITSSDAQYVKHLQTALKKYGFNVKCVTARAKPPSVTVVSLAKSTTVGNCDSATQLSVPLSGTMHQQRESL